MMSQPDHNKAIVSTETIKRSIKASQSRGLECPKHPTFCRICNTSQPMHSPLPCDYCTMKLIPCSALVVTEFDEIRCPRETCPTTISSLALDRRISRTKSMLKAHQEWLPFCPTRPPSDSIPDPEEVPSASQGSGPSPIPDLIRGRQHKY